MQGWGMLRSRLRRNQNFDEEEGENKMVASLHALVQKARFNREQEELRALNELTTQERRALSGLADMSATERQEAEEADKEGDVEMGAGNHTEKQMDMARFKNLIKKEVHKNAAVHALHGSPAGHGRGSSGGVAFTESTGKGPDTEDRLGEGQELAQGKGSGGGGVVFAEENGKELKEKKPGLEKGATTYGASRASVFKEVGNRASVLSIDLHEVYWLGRSDLFTKVRRGRGLVPSPRSLTRPPPHQSIAPADRRHPPAAARGVLRAPRHELRAPLQPHGHALRLPDDDGPARAAHHRAAHKVHQHLRHAQGRLRARHRGR